MRLYFRRIISAGYTQWLEADENFLYVTDKGSLNGTFINGKKIAANVKTKCSVRDEITFADICFIVV